MSNDIKQQEAIDYLGKNIIVSASAGAGKTRVLTNRFIKRCVQDRVPVDQILAMTFTKAAAEEMKNRVATSLTSKLLEAKDQEEKSYIEKQLSLLANCHITTIHSFCLSIIEKYYPMISLNPKIAKNILDDTHQQQLYKKAYHTVLKEELQTNYENILEVFSLFSKRSEDYDEIFKILLDIISEANSSLDQDQFYQDLIDHGAPISKLSDLDEYILDGFYSFLELEVLNMKMRNQEMKDHAINNEKVLKQVELFSIIDVQLENVSLMLQQRNYAMLKTSFENLASHSKTPAGGKEDDVYKKMRDDFYASLKRCLEYLYDESIYIKDHNAMAKPLETLVLLAKRTSLTYQTYKCEEGYMDFGDMEHYAYAILTANDHAVSKIYQNHFQEVMVDEFQDTSTLQNEIVKLVGKDGTIFRVGDVKQSIYRFRQAKPELMRDLIKEEKNHSIVLENNYRSKETIVEYCNELFDNLMNVEHCKDTYSQDDRVKAGSLDQKVDLAPVEFAFIEEEKDEFDRAITGSSLVKARWIAAKIQERVKLIEIENKRRIEANKNKPKDQQEELLPTYGSFAVLVRSHAYKQYLKQAFDEFAIPYAIDTKQGFYQSDLAQTLFSLFKFLCNEQDTIALSCLLTSTMYQKTAQDLSQYLLNSSNQSFYQGVKENFEQVFDDRENLLEIEKQEGLIGLFNSIASYPCKIDGVNTYFYETLNEKDQANFDYFFEQVVSLQDRLNTLVDLVEFMQDSQDEDSSEAKTIGNDGNLVQVATIHQSKGLQYDTVFLWSTSQFMDQEKKSSVILDAKGYLGLFYMDQATRIKRKTITRLALEHQNNLEDLEENTRLLYVALTRPVRRCYIVDTYKKDYPKQQMSLPLLNQRMGMTGLIMTARPSNQDLFIYRHYHEVSKPESQNTQVETSPIKVPRLTFQHKALPELTTPSGKLRPLYPLSFQSSSGSTYGTMVHETIEKLPNRMWTKEDYQALHVPEYLQKKFDQFSQCSYYQKALSGTIYKEKDFYVEDDEQRMHGTIDFYAIVENEIYLIDFKTDNLEENELIETYKDQLNDYQTALKKLYPKISTIHKALYSFHLEKLIELN